MLAISMHAYVPSTEHMCLSRMVILRPLVDCHVTFYLMLVAGDGDLRGPFSYDVSGGFGLPIGAAAGRYYVLYTLNV